jgi:hypothetical protein
MMSTRRDVLKAVFAAGVMPTASASGATLNDIGLQLYTVRDPLTADFAGTLREVARLGYREVEFAGILGPGAKQARELLAQFGLRAPSMHVEYESLRGNLPQSLEVATSLGVSFVVCPWLDPAQHPALDDWKRVSAALNTIGEQCAHVGLAFAYHNHDFELRPLGGAMRPFESFWRRQTKNSSSSSSTSTGRRKRESIRSHTSPHISAAFRCFT